MHTPSFVIVAEVIVFDAVAATIDNCVKINSTTKYLTYK